MYQSCKILLSELDCQQFESLKEALLNFVGSL